MDDGRCQQGRQVGERALLEMEVFYGLVQRSRETTDHLCLLQPNQPLPSDPAIMGNKHSRGVNRMGGNGPTKESHTGSIGRDQHGNKVDNGSEKKQRGLCGMHFSATRAKL